MPTITFVHGNGDRDDVEVSVGDTVMQAAVDHLIRGVIGECGGQLSCATCHVFVAPEWFDRLPVASEHETAMLEATSEEPTKFSRLGCQIVCDDSLNGLVVQVPASQQ